MSVPVCCPYCQRLTAQDGPAPPRAVPPVASTPSSCTKPLRAPLNRPRFAFWRHASVQHSPKKRLVYSLSTCPSARGRSASPWWSVAYRRHPRVLAHPIAESGTYRERKSRGSDQRARPAWDPPFSYISRASSVVGQRRTPLFLAIAMTYHISTAVSILNNFRHYHSLRKPGHSIMNTRVQLPFFLLAFHIGIVSGSVMYTSFTRVNRAVESTGVALLSSRSRCRILRLWTVFLDPLRTGVGAFTSLSAKTAVFFLFAAGVLGLYAVSSAKEPGQSQ